MAAIHGSKAVFKLDDNTSTLQDISTYIRDVKIDQEAKAVFRAVSGLLQETYEIGQTSGLILLEGPTQAYIINHLQGMWVSNAARDLLYNFQYGPNGTATGQPRVRGTCRLINFHLGSAMTDAAEWKATLEITNNVVTADTWP